MTFTQWTLIYSLPQACEKVPPSHLFRHNVFRFDTLGVLRAVYRLHEGELHVNLVLLLLAICCHCLHARLWCNVALLKAFAV